MVKGYNTLLIQKLTNGSTLVLEWIFRCNFKFEDTKKPHNLLINGKHNLQGKKHNDEIKTFIKLKVGRQTICRLSSKNVIAGKKSEAIFFSFLLCGLRLMINNEYFTNIICKHNRPEKKIKVRKYQSLNSKWCVALG